MLADKAPIDQAAFDESIHKPRPGFEPPLIHFGFAFKTEQVLAYFDRRKLSLGGDITWASVSGSDHGDGERALVLYAMMKMMCLRLGRLCGTTFELAKPFSQEYHGMIEIYNNYDMDERQFDEPQDEDEVIEILRRELNFGEHKSEPNWWYSMDHAVSHTLHRR